MRTLVTRGLMLMAFAFMGFVGSAANVHLDSSHVSVEANQTSARYMLPETCTDRLMFGCPKP